MTLTAHFRRFFRPSVSALIGDGRLDLVEAGGWFGRRLVVLPRARCQFQFIPGDHRSARARQALRLKLHYRAPFETLGLHMAPDASGTAVWTWDQAAVDAALGRAGEGEGDATGADLIPESALMASGRDATGARLVRCLDGVEGQVWRDGALRVSRWWRALPTPGDWQAFLKAAGVGFEAGQPVPPPETPAWRAQPIVDGPVRDWAPALVRARALSLAAIVLAAPVTYQSVQWGHAAWRAAEAERALAARREAARPLLAARRDSLAALRAIETQAALGDEALLVRSLLEAVQALDAFRFHIQRVAYADGRVTLWIEDFGRQDGAALVQTLEELDGWSGVSLLPGARSVMKVEADLGRFATEFATLAEAGR
ncbi:hypothetical protein EV659_10857 [Rhodothalassium salexigens DSM 2132]|uniref:Uncharacterized protein n=1 Tax=Rhodothalassium salexigens DSM 2132 TaxID=1188247 RepID=A0A4R2PER3_RHOSA|nr:hypothetical protein [Rhodothalassium salexigens]MBB4212083.1 hypothetical protein [Rhodothalassium salexigens DSM 2132]MBK1638300.1 hypothetical protein [Rhodothalassium salexigens DSM 2132]TCP32958.1 hypothetical protein EV659_10857 [Rhodothalassium salexigens DSM 2132]